MKNIFSLIADFECLTDIIIAVSKFDKDFKEEIDSEIESIFSQTKDEGERIYSLANYIEWDIIRFRDTAATKQIFKLAESFKDSDYYLRDYLFDLAEWIDRATVMIDYYKIAKVLIDDFQKRMATAKKKTVKKAA